MKVNFSSGNVSRLEDVRMTLKKHQKFCFSALGILAKNYVFLQALERMHVKYYSADCTQIQ